MNRMILALRTGGRSRVLLGAVIAVAAALLATDIYAQHRPPNSHAIYISAVEFKGSTTSDKVAPPDIDPAKVSRGYAYKAPGQADPTAPQRWEVASYQFSPAFMTVHQGDSIMLSVFIVNGDHHEVQITDPDGQDVVGKRLWDRGREYTLFFQVQKIGAYQLECGTHAPSMTATILVLPH